MFYLSSFLTDGFGFAITRCATCADLIAYEKVTWKESDRDLADHLLTEIGVPNLLHWCLALAIYATIHFEWRHS